MKKSCAVVTVLAACLTSIHGARADATLRSLASFNGSNGNEPSGGLIVDTLGNLYGAAWKGGATGDGTIFKLPAGSNSISTLASFKLSTCGSNPYCGLMADAAGNFYGTTQRGGDISLPGGSGGNGYGTVFKLAAGSSTISTLGSFESTNGYYPLGGVIADAAGNLYGTTMDGGAKSDGVIYKLGFGSNTITALASFNNTNGRLPAGNLVMDGAGNLYGTTEVGGKNGDGTIFKLTAGSGTISTLFSFGGANGRQPQTGLMIDSQGNLYGTTRYGGDMSLYNGNDFYGDGTIFELAAGSSTITTLASFEGTNGNQPIANLLEDAAGDLFGTTSFGGDLTLNGGQGEGTVFELAAGSNTITALGIFEGSNGFGPIDGLVADGVGNLYGTTQVGGAHNDGTIFEVTNSGFVVPEPASLGLVVVALAGMLVRRR